MKHPEDDHPIYIRALMAAILLGASANPSDYRKWSRDGTHVTETDFDRLMEDVRILLSRAVRQYIGATTAARREPGRDPEPETRGPAE